MKSVCKCASQVSIQKQVHDIGDMGTFNLFRRPAKIRGGMVLNSYYCMPSKGYLFIYIYIIIYFYPTHCISAVGASTCSGLCGRHPSVAHEAGGRPERLVL